MNVLLSDIAKCVLPVYSKLYSYVFYPYFTSNSANPLSRVDLINSAYELLKDTDEDLYRAYSFMLTYGLYDIEPESDKRSPSAFETYLYDYDAPYIFISTASDSSDIATLFHEFGHFFDDYTNYASGGAMDILEISSQGLELLMLTRLKGTVSESDVTYLQYSALCSSLETLIFQGFYADVEHTIYGLSYSDITVESINAAVISSARKFSLNTSYVNDASVLVIPHIFLYPHYVQSYCTSLLPALELYFIESENAGEGFEVYKELVDREAGASYRETLEDSGLTYPFDKGFVERICNEIHYQLYGTYYFNSSNNNTNAA